jgi:cysteinyl-tRNA synthetase
MSIFIYNSLARKKEEFIPLNPPKVNIYTCGVTVYDESHIGHARSLYIFDVMRRYLKYRGFEVKFVRNITDIDDKIINRANELKTDWKDLIKKYIDRYYEDLKSLGIGKADYEPRATENIPDMVMFINGLIEKGIAYESGGDVYFNVRKFPGYGKLSGQSIDAMQEAVRIDKSELKKDPLDFALWKKSKENEPSWDSPWGNGRPGWHIECSVMSQKFLKTDTLDIHAGGRDLIFPHHENEIAQAVAFTGKPFAKYWIHHGLLTINGQKMAKSAGNFVTIKDFIEKYKDADLLKLFFLSTHYSHPIDYNEKKIEETIKQKYSFNIFFLGVSTWKQIWNYWVSQPELGALKNKTKTPFSKEDKDKVDRIYKKFEQAMDDNFNTPQALGHLFELRDLGLEFISSDTEEGFSYIEGVLKKFFNLFGISTVDYILSKEELQLCIDEEIARAKKDYKKSDALRITAASKYNLIITNTAGNAAINIVKFYKVGE